MSNQAVIGNMLVLTKVRMTPLCQPGFTFISRGRYESFTVISSLLIPILSSKITIKHTATGPLPKGMCGVDYEKVQSDLGPKLAKLA